MPQLLLELFSEEIPARMQADAARDLERMARERLKAAGFAPEAMCGFAGPRRLTLVVDGLPAAQADRGEERKGPRVGAPDAAIEGFLRSTGLVRDQLVERDGVYFAQIAHAGRPTPEIIAEIVPDIVRQFPWPKSMKWGTGSLRWVRPLQRILCVFDGKVVPFNIDGIESGDLTEGHRFMGSKRPFMVRGFDDYAQKLAADFVVLDPAERRARILDGATAIAAARGLDLVQDEGLLDEVAGLAEWPVPLLGDMDPAFLDLPAEVVRTSMRTHQKYFALRDPAAGGLAPHFIAVANIEAHDGGKAIAAGNARVLSARLNDARFFWDEDRKVPLAARLERLKGVTFHAKLGTMYERVERIEALARHLAPVTGADPETAAEAARLCKADLATGMVGEFPELQGVMGRYYAIGEGMPAEIADAIRDHYRPQGPTDEVPTAPTSAAVALADKLDVLIGFFAIGEKPTGSRDPFALRRSALGLIRIVLEGRVTMSLRRSIEHADSVRALVGGGAAGTVNPLELIGFIADRLKVVLREQGRRHDLVDAVFALGDDDLVRIVDRVEALDGFLTTEDGANLLAGFKRATNILRAEEKKAPLPHGQVERLAGAPPQETALINALASVTPRVEADLAVEDFTAAMRALAALRSPVDGFFEHVLVNDPDAATRDNRLRLLIQVRDLMGRVADFSLVSG
ncbi:MAG TPA: glycine--tRNA ligase subunit beta [Caulobacteraceae bacterium]|jgi:glycyl-tRNA synthetase beta chain|nr:glycine--tRNA ligase subunit beta [Caulobacteraceae bacterium]